jgi:hypothetical protein
MSDLQLVPCSIQDAREFVRQFHRHHAPPLSGLFALSVSTGERICGVAIVGRPVARAFDDGFTAEVTRLATDGTKNACSMMYSACWRAARALGYRRLITYILSTEPGTSLRAAGWREVAKTRAYTWNRANRPRVDRYPLQSKLRFEVSL